MHNKKCHFLDKSGFLLIILSLSLSCSLISHDRAPNIDNADMERESNQAMAVWWHDDELAKNAIISAIALRIARPELSNIDEFRNHYSNIADLLLLFDAMETERSLETLASLRSYYLGEHPGEIYSCLLLRKGARIEPILKRMLKSEDNECLATFLDVPVSGTPGAKPYACLSDELYRILLNSHLEKIERNEWCVIEQ